MEYPEISGSLIYPFIQKRNGKKGNGNVGMRILNDRKSQAVFDLMCKV